MTKQYNLFQYIVIACAVICCFATAFIPPFFGLSVAGFRVLGVLFGAILLWVFVDTGWSSFLVLLSLMMIPEVGVKTVTATSFGNDTAVFLLICFMLSATLTKTGLAKRISIWFITNKLGRRSPWMTIIMYFIAEFLLSLVLSSTSTFVMFFPIMAEILTSVGYKKEDGPAVGAMMTLGTVVVGQIANSCTPVSHAMSILGMSTYNNYTGNTIDFVTYCAVLIPVAIVMFVFWMLIAKFLWKPDVSKFSNLDFDALKNSVDPISKREIVAAVIYALVLILWVIPGISKYISPSLYAVFGLINQNYPPLIALFVLNLIYLDGKPVLAFKDAFANINWNTFVFIGTVMCLGSCVSDKNIGIREWMTTIFSPIAEKLGPTGFIVAICVFGVVITNFISNAVGLAVVFAIAMPICAGIFENEINQMMIAILMTASIQYAWATPASTPNAVVAADSGWLDVKIMFKWGMITVMFVCIAMVCIGIPLGNLIC